MADQHITRTSLAGLRPVGEAGDYSYETVSQLLRRSLGERHAALFAEPVPTQDGLSVDWVTSLLGDVQKADRLAEPQAASLKTDLQTLVQDIRDLAESLERKQEPGARRQAVLLRNALHLPDDSSLYRVGDQPVLVQWGFEKADKGEGSELLFFEPPEPKQASKVVTVFSPDEKGITIGRHAGPGKVALDNPGVSERHARYSVKGDDLVLRDLGSTNGTFVNGERITGETKVGPDDRVDIGPYRFEYDGEKVAVDDRASAAGLSVVDVTREVSVSGSPTPLRILDNVSLEIAAGEFVCIVGPSGGGKSTLMNVMSGRARPTSGQVIFNGLDLYDNFELLKQSIAMVPQDDLLHETLTLRRALGYTARLRLPPDMRGRERMEIIERAAASVGLTQRTDTRITKLSGGQRKRCSLANELLDRPALLFLDEVTSGLDESTDQEIMALLRNMADSGMTIVCVTHTLANIEAYCDRVIIMNVGGVMAFDGPPSEALRFFGVERLGEVFTKLPERSPADWRAAFEALGTHGDGTQRQTADANPPKRRARPLAALGRTLRQTAILTHRNFALLRADARIWAMALVQSLLIGVLVGYAFSDFGPAGVVLRSEVSLLLMLGLAGLWIGCSSSSKDIVGELKIFERENDVNLSSFAFVISKLLVTGLFTMIQMALVFALAWAIAQDIPGDPLLQAAFSIFAAFAGCCLGLLISAVTKTTEQATTLVPIILVPQLILSGVIVPHLPEIAERVSDYAVTSFVLIEGMKSVLIETEGPIQQFNAVSGETTEMSARSYQECALLIAAHCVVALLITLYVVSGRQRRRHKNP